MTHPRPEYAPISLLQVSDDRLLVGGRSLDDLAALAGQTPYYAYDRDAMRRRAEALRIALPPAMRVHYAMKANPMPAVVSHMIDLVDGIDVASAGEMRLALDAGASAATMSFAGPGKRDVELAAAVEAGVTINIESMGELARVAHAGDRVGERPRVAVRVNPDFLLKASRLKMGGGPKQFGIDAEIVPEALESIADLDLHFRGFHIFSGTQNLLPDSLIEAQAATFDLADRLAQSAPSPIETLNIGGGFGIPYFPGDTALDLAPVAEHLAEQLAVHREALGNPEVIVELGRYLVGEAGVYVCSVIDRKVSRGQTFLVTDGGLHHHLAASGNFGQVIRRNFPVVVADRVYGGVRETATVVGPLCTPLDVLANQTELGVAHPGDLIAVLQSGAYGYSASPHAFLSHPPPVELLV